MRYDYEIKVDDSYILDNSTKSDGTPYISGATVHDYSSSGERLTIGGTVSNKLTVLFHNAPTTSFDGMKLELNIKEVTETGDDGSDVSVNVTDIEQFMEDMEKITDGTNSDTGSDITLDNIEAIATDPASETDNYEVAQTGSAGSNSEVPTNNNYRDNGTDIAGASSADTEELTDWIKFGTYYVTSYKKIDDFTYEITALDGFVLMGDTYTPTITSGTIAAFYDDFTSQLEAMGINVNDEVFPSATITWSGSYSFREAAGYFASFIGGYANFGREGYLDLRPYLKSERTIPYSDVIDYRETANDITINAVACDRIPSVNATDYISLGEDDTIEMEFVNPFMTETLLQNVLDTYLYTVYTPCLLECQYGWELQSGDFVQVELEEDTKWICVTNMVIGLDEGRAKISSIGNSATLATNKNVSKTMRDLIEAGKTATNYITEDESGALVIRRDTDDYNVRIDADSVDIRNGNTVLASFGEETTLGETGTLKMCSPEHIQFLMEDGTYTPARMVNRSGITPNGWVWEIYTRTNYSIADDSYLEANAIDTYTPKSGNTAFGSTGLYYKDTTKSIASLWNEDQVYGNLEYLEEGLPQILVQANGNTGSGFVSVWRATLDLGNKVIRTRLVSNSSNNMGTVTLSYQLKMFMNTRDDSFDGE